ncbi:hypothetical protein Ahy_A04g018425 [Arachis hypogaea]|uniref:Uncharacterized protein n=1 Tax=Arachis hypogaea TaxID=3818 RepID=A0A445DDL8_ARAHY|nr:hypothetical protein Ahy_A04g018425 [Arachis hypogaea]
MNSDSEEDFEVTCEAGDEDEDGDVGVEAAAENVVVHLSSNQPMDVPPFMPELDLEAMHALEFLEYANIGIADPEDGEFRIGMEYSSRKSVVTTIRSFTISIGVDYDVYESEPQTFYAKCKMYGRGCDWLNRASLIRKKVVHRFDRRNEVFEVREMTIEKVLVVDLARRTCDCGHFQLYVHDVYKMTEVRKVCRFEFTPFGDPKTWPAYEGLTLVANPALRRTSKGRPKLTRYLNEMDSRDMRGPWICHICGA